MTTPDQEAAQELQPSRFAWRYLDQEQARELWDELVDWTTWLRERYELDTKIPPCWYRHGPVVEELSALMVAWTDAYYRGDEYRDDLTAWHTQWLWPAVHRLHTVTDFETCSQERCANTSSAPVTLIGLGAFIQSDINDRHVSHSPAERMNKATEEVTPAPTNDLISVSDMDAAIDTGIAQPTGTADLGHAIIFSNSIWVFNQFTGFWIRCCNTEQ